MLIFLSASLLDEGRLPETCRRRSGDGGLRAWLVTTHSGGLGAPPGGHYEPPARSWRTIRGQSGRKRGPRSEIRRVERRKARRPASLAGGPLFAKIWRSGDRPDRKAGHEVRRSAPAPVGAPLPSGAT